MKRLLPICFLASVIFTMFAGPVENAYSQSTSTLVHYWYFPEFATQTYTDPNVPNIYEDFDVTGDTTKAWLEYYLIPGTSSSYGTANTTDQLDGVACVDSSVADHGNARNGVGPNGWALRFRNPVDSIEARWHMPTTGYSNPVITYALESSSPTSGDSTQVFSYSVNGGLSWKSADISVNGVNVDTLSVANNAIYQGALWGLVVITFAGDDSVNNNPNFIFRITFRGNAALQKGNNRFADVTMDGGGSGGNKPPPGKIAVVTPESGNIFVPNEQDTINFTVNSSVGQVRTIQFSSDGGSTWSPAGTVTGGTFYVWTVPNVATEQGEINVTDSAGVTASSNEFVIYPVTSANRIVHYWDFNTLGQAYHNPGIPALPADFSANSSERGSIVYVIDTANPAYIGYIDDVAGDTSSTDGLNLFGEPGGNALRVRNPTNAMELHFVIPTTGYEGISINYALQSSSLSGPQREFFSYSPDGTTWITNGITVNGVAQDSLDVTPLQYQSTVNGVYGVVNIGFNSSAIMVDNNPSFIFRMKFGDTATTGTSGNNRIDNFAVMASATDGVNETTQVQQQLDISPNPAVDYVSFDNPFTSLATVSVLDMLGRELIHSDATASSNVEINTSKLMPGSYYIHIQNVSSGAEYIAKFVKE